MNRPELIELLQELVESDLVVGSNIYDHPCAVAIKAINQCFDDIKFLQGIAKGNERNKCKRIQVMVKGIYDPSW